MARPPKNAKGPSATERMEMAFWECMGEMPFEKITVRDIVERSKVNRNSFYYHYGDMWDLAEAAVRGTTMIELAHMIIDGDITSPKLANEVSGDPEAAGRFERLRLLAGPHGNQRLIGIAKDVIVGEWLEMYGLTPDFLSDSALATIDFAFGGISALWASDRFSSIEDMLAAISKSGLVAHSISELRQELTLCAENRVASRREISPKVEEPAIEGEPQTRPYEEETAAVSSEVETDEAAEEVAVETVEETVEVEEIVEVVEIVEVEEIIEEVEVIETVEPEPESEPEPEPEADVQMSLF